MPVDAEPEARPSAGENAGEEVTAPLVFADSATEEFVSQTQQAACPPSRSDIAPLFSNPIMGEGIYGSWESCYHYCPEGSFAYGLRVKSEPGLGSGGDDTAMNGAKLRCYNPSTGVFTGEVAAAESPWGGYLGFKECPGGWNEPLAGGRMRIEPNQQGGDDTSANELIGWCHDPQSNSGPTILPPTHTHWGSLTTLRSCPIGSAVCGIRSKLEASVGSGDDTALNGIQFRCCTFQ